MLGHHIRTTPSSYSKRLKYVELFILFGHVYIVQLIILFLWNFIQIFHLPHLKSLTLYYLFEWTISQVNRHKAHEASINYVVLVHKTVKSTIDKGVGGGECARSNKMGISRSNLLHNVSFICTTTTFATKCCRHNLW